MLSLPNELLKKIMNTEAKTVRIGSIVWPRRTAPVTRSSKSGKPGYTIRRHNKKTDDLLSESKKLDDLFRRILYNDENVKKVISELEKRSNLRTNTRTLTSVPMRVTNIYAHRKDNTRDSESSALGKISKCLQNVARPPLLARSTAEMRQQRLEKEKKIQTQRKQEIQDLKTRIAYRETLNQHRYAAEAYAAEAAARTLAQNVKFYEQHHGNTPFGQSVIRILKKNLASKRPGSANKPAKRARTSRT
tara:strand:+ start:1112 stop:1852 length:741 start_codon:yes stop_codon:yes gene_type:complete